MAAVAAVASVSGGSTVVAPGQNGVVVGAAPVGASAMTGTLTGTFGLAAVLSGAATLTAPTKVDKGAIAALVGNATVTAALPIFLVQSAVAGEATVVAPAEAVYTATSSLAGEATTSADPDMALAAVAAPAGEATVVADPDMQLAAVAAPVGDAVLTAAPFVTADDERSADIAGASTMTADLTGIFQAAAAVSGSATIVRAVAIVRKEKPLALPEVDLPAIPLDTERFIGFQPNRDPHQRPSQVSVVLDSAAAFRDVDGDAFVQRLSSPSGLRAGGRGPSIKAPPDDAASLEVQRQIAEQSGRVITSVPSSDDDT